jgi:hypothetical protein
MSFTSQLSASKEKMLIAFLVLLVIIILIILVIDFIVPKLSESQVTPGGPTPPSFLNTPLPSIKKIKEAVDNPRIDEFKFYQPVFTPLSNDSSAGTGTGSTSPETIEDLIKDLKVGQMGRPNPFIPYEENRK